MRRTKKAKRTSYVEREIMIPKKFLNRAEQKIMATDGLREEFLELSSYDRQGLIGQLAFMIMLKENCISI